MPRVRSVEFHNEIEAWYPIHDPNVFQINVPDEGPQALPIVNPPVPMNSPTDGLFLPPPPN